MELTRTELADRLENCLEISKGLDDIEVTLTTKFAESLLMALRAAPGAERKERLESQCKCGLMSVPEGADVVAWYWQRHSREACTLELPNVKCWCGLLRSEHLEGHADAPPAGQGATAVKWMPEDEARLDAALFGKSSAPLAWIRADGLLVRYEADKVEGYTHYPLYLALAHGERQLDWSTVRSIMAQGADIQKDYMAGNHASYEAYAARMDAAAHERLEGLTAESISPGKRALAEMLLRQSALAHGERQAADQADYTNGYTAGHAQGQAEGLERAAKLARECRVLIDDDLPPVKMVKDAADQIATQIEALAAPAKQPEGGHSIYLCSKHGGIGFVSDCRECKALPAAAVPERK